MRILTFLLLFFSMLFSPPLAAADYFWIGGTGNWSDISNWATTSGGVITHPQAPTADDDVFFDVNSFSAAGEIVTLNSTIAFCRNMSWNGVTNAPTFTGDANVVFNIYGSWSLSPDMTFDFLGSTIFTGDQANNIVNFETHNCGQDITFSGMGTWMLMSDISVDSAFILTEGTLNTNGQNINCKYFDAQTPNLRTLNLGASVVNISGATIDPFSGNLPDQVIQPLHIHASNLSMDAGNSVFILTNPAVDIWIQGPGTVNFNRVVLNSAMGNSVIRPWLPLQNPDNTPVINFNELELFHFTTLEGSQQIGNLILHPDQRYIFESDAVFTFESIEAIGDCANTIVLESSGGASPSFFETANDITTSFVSLRGIAAIGAGSFMANDAIDLGNNNGWTIVPRIAADFFWVGNTGNWNDPLNWSFSSGGPSSGCIPAAQDDVFFDANSFSAAGQIVTINIENAYCHDMDWTGATNNPELAGPMGNSLHLTASLLFIPAIQHSFQGHFYFESEEQGNTITLAGHNFNNNIYFSGVSGEWIFQDAVYVENSLNFLSGTLRSNDQDLDIAHFNAETDFLRSLYLGSSYIRVNSRDFGSADWRVNATNLTFDAGTSTIESIGGSSNLIRSFGIGTMVYNRIIFNSWEGRLFSNIDLPGTTVEIDSLSFNQRGFISGNTNINYCYLNAGYSYTITNGSLQTITELDASGNCANGFVAIESSSLGQMTNFNIAADHTFERLSLHGINQMGSGQLQASNSYDGGDNSGWDFTNINGRDLYWVGGDGNWNDMANWSLSSGGAGGECVPTPVDDVFFDNNSFPAPGAMVFSTLNSNVFCRNMTWLPGINMFPRLQLNDIYIYGSLDIQSDLDWAAFFSFFRGNGNHSILSTGVALSHLYFEGTGVYTLLDALVAGDIRLYSGTFDTNDQDVEANRLIVDGVASTKNLILGNSYIRLTDGSPNFYVSSIQIFSLGLTIAPGQSIIELTHPNAAISATYPVDFHNILFSNPEGDAFIDAVDANFNKINFFGNGNLNGNLTTDSLLLSAGKAYVFESTQTQTINSYWQVIGNNCTPISLTSSIIGNQANVSMPSGGIILANFIQMRDINAMGEANFLAGAFSTDIDNSNTGWTFETAPEFIDVGFLGPDQVLCANQSLTLSAYNFTQNEIYLWQDGSTNAVFEVNQSGIYTAQVTFADNCIVQDEIEVITAQDFMVDILDDPDLCAGESIVLDANMGINGASYLWQDASTDPTLEVTVAGDYSVEVTINGCLFSDMTTVSVTPYPELDLGADLSVCDEESFTLQSNVTADTYLWQDGSIVDNFTGTAQGIYWLEAANNQCAVRDSVNVVYVSNAAINLGADTLLCDQTDFLLEMSIPNASYVWQDASTANTFSATATGEYWVEVTLQGCTATDSIQLTFQNNPMLDFGDEIFACQGDLVTLTAGVIADAYQWSDGDTDADFSTLIAGNYFLDVSFGQCVVRENFEIILHELPVIQSLGDDVDLCEGESRILSALTDQGTIEWQDGSTNVDLIINTAGVYWFIANNQGCVNGDTILINALPSPMPELNVNNATACEGDSIEIILSPINGTVTWNDGSGENALTVTTAGTYWVEVENAAACINRDSLDITFAAKPLLELGEDVTACDTEPFVVTANFTEGILTWFDGSMQPTYTVEKPETITAILDNNGCITTDSIHVNFKECFIFQAFIPNVFSPNNDGVNDYFRPFFNDGVNIISYRMSIFNRWGSPIFTTTDLNTPWEGRFNEQVVDIGVYVYFIEITFEDDLGRGNKTLSGDVAVLR